MRITHKALLGILVTFCHLLCTSFDENRSRHANVHPEARWIGSAWRFEEFFSGDRRKVTYWYENGNPRSQMNFKGNLLDGTSVTYKEDGTISTLEYKDDIANGSMHIQLPNGNELSSTYVKGVLQGPYTYIKKFVYAETGTYVNGKKEGAVLFKYLNGERIEGTFKNGKMHGPWPWYKSNGALRGEVVYENGIVVKKNILEPVFDFELQY